MDGSTLNAPILRGEFEMCRLFIGADAHLWDSSTKSWRIDGMVTSVRLENYFWTILAEIALRDQIEHSPTAD